MRAKPKRKSHDKKPRALRLRPVEEAAPRATSSPTAVAAEALRTGVLPPRTRPRREDIPHEADTMCAGDPDDCTLENEYGGEETPGGSASTPDQNGVDEIGRAYGLQEEDGGSLRSAGEVLARRDRHRSELTAPRKPS